MLLKAGSRPVRLMLCLALWAGTPGAAPAAAPEQPASGRHTLMHDGLERGYVVRVPGLPAPGARLPLVLVLHGGGGNAGFAERMTGFTGKAMQEGFIVVYPEGTGRFKGLLGGSLLTWNAGHCCGQAMQRRVDDVGFIAALIDKLVADYPVDPARIYATGMSNGGMMTHRLGIALSDRIAAIAPVVATVFGDEAKPARPVSALMINGLLDTSVPHLGGAPGGRFPGAWDGTPAQPAPAQATFWAGADGCAREPERRDAGAYILLRHACPADEAVELYLVKDNGHAWPGGQPGGRRGDKPSASLDATDLIWRFFRAHARNARPGMETPARQSAAP